MNSQDLVFIAVIEKEPGLLFGGWFPDCPNATSVGRTFDECAEAARDSLRSWAASLIADGDELPSPRALDELKVDPVVADACERGAVLVAVPLVGAQG